jgi:hypothetical protein
MVPTEKKQQESCGTASKENSKRECKTPGTTRKTTTGKSVSFKPMAHAKNTLHIINYTEEEVKACWYTREEENDRRRHIKLTVAAIEQDVDLFEEEDEYCIRGLEFRIPVLARSMYRSRRRALVVVFDEQIRQWQTDKDCAYLIAEKYQACAQKCRKDAHRRGLADGKAANDMYFQEFPCNGVVDRTPQPPMRHLSNLAPLHKTMTSTAA